MEHRAPVILRLAERRNVNPDEHSHILKCCRVPVCSKRNSNESLFWQVVIESCRVQLVVDVYKLFLRLLARHAIVPGENFFYKHVFFYIHFLFLFAFSASSRKSLRFAPLGSISPPSHLATVCWRQPIRSAIACCVSPRIFLIRFICLGDISPLYRTV